MIIDQSDLEKILDAVREAETFHKRRDEMNAQTHLAKEVRYSPLTTTLTAARERGEMVRNRNLVNP